ncbi:hypothetical protein SUGI_1204440 [Cryptomeria japonica]|uniref:U-box domain-containing protein 44 n=1 Tax=Cryptomeria japonica TaxID=3369 RepID=UPI002414CFBC|nr:U-box domain-containing protein 44 [Cryptomeria japonica]GLJ56103.1 hypothetical protein SUGI_1204440 [Cryptomeria japonica]
MAAGGVLGNVALVPVSEVLARLVVLTTETINAAHDVMIKQESLTELSKYLEHIKPILRELANKNVRESETIRKALEILERELKAAKNVTDSCSQKSRFYLLVNCRNIVKQVQDITREIGHALSLVPLASLDMSLSIQLKAHKLCKDMQNAEFKAAVVEEEIVNKIESGVRERNANSVYANNLLLQIAKAVGISTDTSALKQEFEEFKKDMVDAQLRKNQAEALQMEQIIGLLGWADVASSAKERDQKYHDKRISLGSHHLPPLQSFYCPISQEVMDDPVEISSGQTFERSAIEKWFAEGHTTCPLTNQMLTSKELRPNIILRRSIQEWKDRNTVIAIALLKPKLESGEEQAVLYAINELLRLSEEKETHRHWIAAEGYIGLLVDLLGRSKPSIRKRTLALLCSLIKDNSDNKARITEVEHAIDFIVRSLARDIGEGTRAVALLLELSKDKDVCEQIGKVQGCILLLVTMSNNDNPQASKSAMEILENLSYSERNVVQMAEANYFKPLIQRLNEGSTTVKNVMASALSEMGLTDQSKAALVKEGVVAPLLEMISNGNVESKSAAIGALQNLSSLPENALQMTKDGVVQPILDLLYTPKSIVLTLREQAASTFANLAASIALPESTSDTVVALLESDEVIYKLLSLINLTGPSIQGSILRAFHAMCSAPTAVEVREKLREGGAIQILLTFCESSNLELRANAIKLLFSLSQDGDGSMLAEHLGQSYTEKFVKLLSTSSDEEEKAATIGIIGNLPLYNRQITEWLLEAGTLPMIINILSSGSLRTTGNAVKNQLIENAAGALCRFTIPTDIDLQIKTAGAGLIPVLVRLLGSGTPLAKRRAAISLAQFSENSGKLSRTIQRRKSFSFVCFSAPPDQPCRVHRGICSVNTSFCLVESEAILPLVQVLEEQEGGASEAALEALSTLVYDEFLENGAVEIERVGGIMSIVRMLTVGSAGVQEKAVWILERLFRNERYRTEYGNTAQMPLIDLTQRGTNATRPLAAKILAHLNVLHEQSSYF